MTNNPNPILTYEMIKFALENNEMYFKILDMIDPTLIKNISAPWSYYMYEVGVLHYVFGQLFLFFLRYWLNATQSVESPIFYIIVRILLDMYTFQFLPEHIFELYKTSKLSPELIKMIYDFYELNHKEFLSTDEFAILIS